MIGWVSEGGVISQFCAPCLALLTSIFHWLVEWGLVASLPVSWLGLCRLGVTACRVSSRGGRAFPGPEGSSFRGVVDRRQEPCVYGAGRAWRCSRPSSRRLVQGWSAL